MNMSNAQISSLSVQRQQTAQLVQKAAAMLHSAMATSAGFETVFAQAMASLQLVEADQKKRKLQDQAPKLSEQDVVNLQQHYLVSGVSSVPSSAVELELPDESVQAVSYSDYEELFSDDVFAQAGFVPEMGGVLGNAQNPNLDRLNKVPLQFFIEKAVIALDDLSQLEFRTNDLIDGYIRGTVTEDLVVIETAKLKLAISMVTNIVQTIVQTFKEVQNIPV